MAGTNAALSACGRRQQWELVLLHLEAMTPDVVTFGVLLKSCRQAQVTAQVLGAMRRQGLRVTNEALDAALGAAESGRRWPEAFQLLTEHRQRAGATDLVLLSTALSCCDRWPQGLGLFREVTRELKADRGAYGAALTACKASEAARGSVRSIIERMERCDV